MYRCYVCDSPATQPCPCPLQEEFQQQAVVQQPKINVASGEDVVLEEEVA